MQIFYVQEQEGLILVFEPLQWFISWIMDSSIRIWRQAGAATCHLINLTEIHRDPTTSLCLFLHCLINYRELVVELGQKRDI